MGEIVLENRMDVKRFFFDLNEVLGKRGKAGEKRGFGIFDFTFDYFLEKLV